jgi:hypothetical protein
LGLGGAPTALGLGATLVGEAFCGLGAFTGLGEPLVSLGLGGSGAWEVVFEVLGLRVSSTLGISPPVWESFTGESGSISCGVLHNMQS